MTLKLFLPLSPLSSFVVPFSVTWALAGGPIEEHDAPYFADGVEFGGAPNAFLQSVSGERQRDNFCRFEWTEIGLVDGDPVVDTVRADEGG